MKKSIISLLLAFILILSVGIAVMNGYFNPLPKLGFYDPDRSFDHVAAVSIEHFFYSWTDSPLLLKADIQKAQLLNRDVIVTLEPWYTEAITNDSNRLLKDITDSRYDTYIQSICRVLGSTTLTVYVRWGHEMEIATGRYPWSGKNHEDYISAYRHFVTNCRTLAPNVKYIWSPAGNSGLSAYWPDDAFVDFIGLSIYSFEEWETKNVGHRRSFSEIFVERYGKVRQFNKPIILAEIGVTGTSEYKLAWLEAMNNTLHKYPRVTAAVYFNSRDVEGAWGTEYSVPDWRISVGESEPFYLPYAR